MNEQILIIDQNSSLRPLTYNELNKLGYDVSVHGDVTNVVTFIKGNRTDAILLNIDHMVSSYSELISEIRTNYSKLELPVLILGTDSHSDHLLDLMQLGANDYLFKPFDTSLIESRLNTHIELAKLHIELLNHREAEALKAMVVTFNHQINNALAIAFSKLSKIDKKHQEKEVINLNESLESIKSIVKEISRFTSKKPPIEKYIGDTKMYKIEKATKL